MADLGYYRYQLELYQKMGVLCSLFIDPENPDDFVAGYVGWLNGRQTAIHAVSPVGRYDGILAMRLNTVCSIMGEDDYSERLRRVMMLRRADPKEQMDVEPGEDLIHAMCRKVMDEDRVITLWIKDSEYVGRVTELNDMRVTIDTLDFFGQNPAPVSLNLPEIDMASLGSEDDEMFQLLADNRLAEIPEQG